MDTEIKYYWSRAPGKFVNKFTGKETFVSNGKILSLGPIFPGTVREWYETLLELIHDVAEQLEDKTKCRVTQITTSPDILTILECTIPYRARYVMDSEDPYKPRKIAENSVEEMGTLNNCYKVFKDYNQLSNEIYVQVIDPENSQKLLKQGIVKVLDLTII